ncbi:putative membrane protein [Actinocorallia herbida]|uniref:Putative membrane protein n=1 Tax=Actinocorallia herbida TaxID=58109 RepID=A0A3N1CWN0_9ACTN|nr:anthrone oxygenase family protein [Actinocorallia herbida]ROO85676.1 putative membrane protein [Actinocorallia herbida]
MIRALLLVSAVGAGVGAGVFFAFSTFVMRALGTLPTVQGVAAMQAVNRAAPHPLFMLVLFGTAATGVAAGVSALRDPSAPGAAPAIVGAGLALVPVILTICYHVPYNDRLAGLDPVAPATADYWAAYLSRWTAANHVRCLTGIGAATSFALAYRGLR